MKNKIEQENNEMLRNQIKEAQHHSSELKSVVSSSTQVEPWVVAKMERATTDLSDIAHYLDGRKDMMKQGGMTPQQQNKVERVMHEFKAGELHSGSKQGPVVTNRKQAIAIALAEANAMKMKRGGMYKDGGNVSGKVLEIQFNIPTTLLNENADAFNTKKEFGLFKKNFSSFVKQYVLTQLPEFLNESIENYKYDEFLSDTPNATKSKIENAKGNVKFTLSYKEIENNFGGELDLSSMGKIKLNRFRNYFSQDIGEKMLNSFDDFIEYCLTNPLTEKTQENNVPHIDGEVNIPGYGIFGVQLYYADLASRKDTNKKQQAIIYTIDEKGKKELYLSNTPIYVDTTQSSKEIIIDWLQRNIDREPINEKIIEKLKNLNVGPVNKVIAMDNLEIYPQSLGRVHYDEAIKKIDELGDGWRLPTVKEFYEIFMSNFYIFSGLNNSDNWTSTKDINEDELVEFYVYQSEPGSRNIREYGLEHDKKNVWAVRNKKMKRGGCMYEDGGEVEGIDLFEDYENIPPKVQKVLDKYAESFEDEDYAGLGKAQKELEKIGYTFDFYLDGVAYDLRPVGTKGKSETEEYSEGGSMYKDGGPIGNKIKIGDEVYARWNEDMKWTLGTFKGETENGFEVYDFTIERPDHIEYYFEISKNPYPHFPKKDEVVYQSKNWKSRNYKNYHFNKVDEDGWYKDGGTTDSTIYKVAGRTVTLNKGSKSDGTDWTVTFMNGQIKPLSDVLALIKPFPKGIQKMKDGGNVKDKITNELNTLLEYRNKQIVGSKEYDKYSERITNLKNKLVELSKNKMEDGGNVEADLTKLSNLEKYVNAHKAEIKANRKTYGFMSVAKITNPYDLSSLLGVDSRIFRNAEIPYYAKFVASLLK